MRKRIDATGYDSDKSELPHYLRNYEECFEHLVGEEIKLLELGVGKGGSLLLWRDYFEKGMIIGLDINPVHIEDPTGRIHVYQGYQQDTHLLDRIARKEAPEGFDVIIDDCSHIGELTRISFWHLFENHLKPGGIYAIEDWGTGYWDSWIDGKRYKPGARTAYPGLRPRTASFVRWLLYNRLVQRLCHLTKFTITYKRKIPSHDYGMVGFVKELIDECGMGDITHPKWGSAPYRSSKIYKMHISHGHVIIVKSHPQQSYSNK
jgi:SAM-dependent methyltransferase